VLCGSCSALYPVEQGKGMCTNLRQGKARDARHAEACLTQCGRCVPQSLYMWQLADDRVPLERTLNMRNWRHRLCHY